MNSETRSTQKAAQSKIPRSDPIDLLHSELRYRRVFEAAHDGILIVDPRTRQIVDVNPFLIKFLGYSYEEFIGRELFEFGLLKDEQASQAAFRELQAVGRIRYDDLPLETKDGRRVDVEFVSNLYTEGDQQIIQCNVRDIAARKKLDKTLRDALAKLSQHAADLDEAVARRTADLQRSNMHLETFVYSIAHDLRAPLRALQGFSRLLISDHSSALNPQGFEYIKYISTAAEKMDCLIVDLLAFSEISQKPIDLVPVALDLVVSRALAACDTEIRESKALIENIPPWPTVLAHTVTLQQVLVNLIGNALKFVLTGKRPRVLLRSEVRAGGIVRIWVEDNGIGISPEFHKRIFQVFQRLHNAEYAGTGIGLAIVDKGMERMGGRVGLVSAPGEGSCFWIELKQAFAPSIE